MNLSQVKQYVTGVLKEWDGIKTPYIGENGNWFIGEKDTGVPAEGEKGDDGKSMVDRYSEVVKTGEIPSLDPRIDYIFAPTNGQMW